MNRQITDASAPGADLASPALRDDHGLAAGELTLFSLSA